MKNTRRTLSPLSWRHALLAVVYLVAIAAGLKFGYDFGEQISGRWLGFVLAINGAIFCSFVASMLAERIFKPKQPD
jgi:hypothetical protein